MHWHRKTVILGWIVALIAIGMLSSSVGSDFSEDFKLPASDSQEAFDLLETKLFGLGLAAAVFIDAVIIRSVLVPALMQLFGERAWWLPGWLDRILPRLHVEPAEGDPAPTGEHPVVVSD